MNDPDNMQQGVGELDILRVVRGRAGAEEVAALTVLLLSLRARAERKDAAPERGRRWRPHAQAYRAPSSWQ
ncbi:acyl-CoA carboxylase subunit epsilon [Streptomyces kunmingensis]|uniref:Acyl-CoA carboxylase subunit epsilon n=1 Tax=Streptomyces kunmingensis TaxID=68225 RepID=A0ABU6CBT8_9ACTN|nr:acyl-CoA carboxylase subunit epsilon [Streptomyces kunmingensis]MEB3962170.1 acyl-CoA carboxylase subunit epsilon [Streptomyces kunmingensis]